MRGQGKCGSKSTLIWLRSTLTHRDHGSRFHRSMTRPFFTKDRITHFDIFDRHAEDTISQMKSRFKEGYPLDFQVCCNESHFNMKSYSSASVGNCRQVHSRFSNGIPFWHGCLFSLREFALPYGEWTVHWLVYGSVGRRSEFCHRICRGSNVYPNESEARNRMAFVRVLEGYACSTHESDQ